MVFSVLLLIDNDSTKAINILHSKVVKICCTLDKKL